MKETAIALFILFSSMVSGSFDSSVLVVSDENYPDSAVALGNAFQTGFYIATVLKKLGEYSESIVRISGITRHGKAANLALFMFPEGSTRAFLIEDDINQPDYRYLAQAIQFTKETQ